MRGSVGRCHRCGKELDNLTGNVTYFRGFYVPVNGMNTTSLVEVHLCSDCSKLADGALGLDMYEETKEFFNHVD